MSIKPSLSRTNLLRMNIALAAALFGVFISHLAIANHSVNQAYALTRYQDQYQSLQLDTQKLELHIADLKSAERLASESKRLQLEPAGRIVYIADAGAVALKR